LIIQESACHCQRPIAYQVKQFSTFKHVMVKFEIRNIRRCTDMPVMEPSM
jgi:hypothetical protein